MRTLPVFRITTFVPPERLAAVIAGVLKVCPLTYGRYDQVVWWSAQGIEQFRPLPGSNPTEGSENVVSQLPSVRLELAIPREPELLDRVLRFGVLPSHPWEEPAIFVDEALTVITAPDDSPRIRP
jgi:hypothetical protein